MEEALALFESLVNSKKWWKWSKMFLCFTRYDLFEKKIQSGSSPLNSHFPDYQGPPRDSVQSARHVTRKFTQLLKLRSELGVFYVDATSAEHVRDVVETVLGDGRSHSPRYYHFDRSVNTPNLLEDET
jgi:hypothetical protein